jgi:hypothetical protein
MKKQKVPPINNRVMALFASLILVALLAGAFAYGAWLESRTPRVCVCGCKYTGYGT